MVERSATSRVDHTDSSSWHLVGKPYSSTAWHQYQPDAKQGPILSDTHREGRGQYLRSIGDPLDNETITPAIALINSLTVLAAYCGGLNNVAIIANIVFPHSSYSSSTSYLKIWEVI